MTNLMDTDLGKGSWGTHTWAGSPWAQTCSPPTTAHSSLATGLLIKPLYVWYEEFITDLQSRKEPKRSPSPLCFHITGEKNRGLKSLSNFCEVEMRGQLRPTDSTVCWCFHCAVNMRAPGPDGVHLKLDFRNCKAGTSHQPRREPQSCLPSALTLLVRRAKEVSEPSPIQPF